MRREVQMDVVKSKYSSGYSNLRSSGYRVCIMYPEKKTRAKLTQTPVDSGNPQTSKTLQIYSFVASNILSHFSLSLLLRLSSPPPSPLPSPTTSPILPP